MSFSATPTYAELKTAVANWLHRSDLTNYVDDLILMGEKYVVRKARTRDMETTLNVTMSGGVAALPADFVELKHARIDGSPSTSLQPKAANWIMLRYPLRSADGTPKFIGIDGSNFVFGPYPSSDYTVKGIYYKRLTAIASSANALFTNNPDLYLFAALAESAPFLKNDARVPLWEAKRDRILMDVNGEDQNARFSGGALSMVAA